MKNRNSYFYTYSVIVVWIVVIMATGCTASPTRTETKQVTILYSSVSDFMNDFGGTLRSEFTDINIQVIEFESVLGKGVWNGFKYVPASGQNWDDQAFIQLIKETNPDILYFPESLYPKLLEEGLLRDVTNQLSSEQYWNIDPSLIETFKKMGDGRVFFISDSLASQAIYYNKDIFLNYGLDEPHDKMTWEDVLELSDLITKRGLEDQVIGLQTPNYSMIDLLFIIGEAQGLNWYDTQSQTTLFSNPGWRPVVEKVVREYKSEKGIKIENKSTAHWFNGGHVAMVLDTFRLKDELQKLDSSVNWRMVSAPIVHEDDSLSNSNTFQYLNGIHESTTQSQEVWKVWSYMNSRDVGLARHNGSMFRFTIPVRSFIRDDEVRNLASLYKVTPWVLSGKANMNASVRMENTAKAYLLQQLQKILMDELTLENALTRWDTELHKVMMP
ncbi:ABC transporter substrate-binding protein [Paenibacillus sp. YYML68]|uniref:ABC transporter substrate-binding protein n=1 Tax=Paenibacillus sp. YYML68 TaxID=2909250 RepID=UPI002492D368|nr:ABC transporter substrate-binding protein [Paenibacillus sp. YYML68]